MLCCAAARVEGCLTSLTHATAGKRRTRILPPYRTALLGLLVFFQSFSLSPALPGTSVASRKHASSTAPCPCLPLRPTYVRRLAFAYPLSFLQRTILSSSAEGHFLGPAAANHPSALLYSLQPSTASHIEAELTSRCTITATSSTS